MHESSPRTPEDRDDRRLLELDEDRLDEAKGGALNAYLKMEGETQGKVEGST